MVQLLEDSRYGRQLKLLGVEGQNRLKQATVMVAGIGGLGGTAAMYLAAAGVGKLILAHEGIIHLPDMNRQVLMDSGRIGEERMETALQHLHRINPETELEGHAHRITEESSGSWVEAADIVIDARYDFPERYALNRLCVRHGRPMIEAAMYAYEVSLMTIDPGRTACLECLYPEGGQPWEPLGFPVLGATSGLIGCMAALEAVKWITDAGNLFTDRMYRMNVLDMSSCTIAVKRNPRCPCCGTGGNTDESIAYL
ncbi:HesA/MoeB/ThiF family protein [Paenibacillus sp. FSL H7-0442]|uniref:HesA/MoeB/ThiF family protein n=1 Tax=Paenibacillus sp. FSL H7-0442 TaxID=2921435 RepID=UPI003158C6FF